MTPARMKFPVWLATFVLFMAVPTSAPADGLDYHSAVLQPTPSEPSASGLAEYFATLHDPPTISLSVEIHDISTTDTVAVLVGDNFVTTVTLIDGSGRTDLATAQGDEVPIVRSGDVIQVINPDDGTVLLEGVFE